MANNKADLVIIGAGCGGAYAAWRLAQDSTYAGKDIRVYDLLPRVGGRLVSKWLSELVDDGGLPPDERARLDQFQYVRKSEFGGMRYLTNQYLVSYLLIEWGKTKRWQTVPFQVDAHKNIYNLRGTWMTADDLVNPDKTPYKLEFNERGMTPGGIFLYALNTVLPNAAHMTAEELSAARQSHTYRGIPLYALGFWNVVRDIVSQEAYEYAINGFGYDTTSVNWNVADAIPWYLADFPANVQYRYLCRGYDELPRELMRDAGANGVKLHLNHLLTSLEDEGDQWKLHILDDTKTMQQVRSSEVILAMPRTSLEALKLPSSLKNGSWYQDNVPAISPQPMFKFFLGYPYPWFRTIGLTNGRTVTDSPVRQVYYWGTASDQFFTRDQLIEMGVENPPPAPGPNDTYNPAVVMAYTDGRNVGFWNPLFEQVHRMLDQTYARNVDPAEQEKMARVHDDVGHLFPGFERLDLWSPDRSARQFSSLSLVKDMSSPERHLVEVIQEEMRQIHNLNYIPEPIVFGYADWSRYPFGGGWNSWNPGFKSWEVTRDIQALDKHARSPRKNLYVIGEGYSQAQGWVEGAFDTAEQVLHHYFGLGKPDWIPDAAYEKVLKVT